MSTVTLSNIPALTASVAAPRIVGIEYPLGRTLGAPDDREGHLRILRDTLQAVVEMEQPGEARHLPYSWPEPKAQARTHPPQPTPISAYLRRHPWHYPRFMSRDAPEQFRVLP